MSDPSQKDLNETADNVENEEDNAEPVITIENVNEYFEEQNEAMSNALAILGNADAKKCTYDLLAPVPRQAVFACATCETEIDPLTGKKYQAGFCYGCSLNCHKDHQIYEMWTKRNFNCDCGTDKYKSRACELFDKKGFLNENNHYNHNFEGKYCLCEKEAFESSIDEEQIQCIGCEDWFHLSHLGANAVESDSEEMLCSFCVRKHSFLVYYIADENSITDKAKTETEVSSTAIAPSEPEKSAETGETSIKPSVPEQSTATTSTVQDDATETPVVLGCLLEAAKKRYISRCGSDEIPEDKLITYGFPAFWRSKLCTCDDCTKLYEEQSFGFITSESDTIKSYENITKKERETSQYDQIFEGLPRTQQIVLATLEKKFKRFFESHSDQIITMEHAKQFIERELSTNPKRARF